MQETLIRGSQFRIVWVQSETLFEKYLKQKELKEWLE
jgi:hypothetical protein